jgi:hypothetical protein
MASHSRCGNKLCCTVKARKIKRIRKEINKDRRYVFDIWSENFQNKSKDWELNMWIFLLIYAYQREISTELLVAHIWDLNISYLTFTLILYHSILFLYYVNIYIYQFQTTYFKTHQIGIPEIVYVSGAKIWLKYHVRPSDIQTWLQYYKSFVILDTSNINYALLFNKNLLL